MNTGREAPRWSLVTGPASFTACPLPEAQLLRPFRTKEKLRNGVRRNLFIVRAVAGEAAFEEHERVDFPWVGDEAAVALQIARHLARSAAFPARKRDVRMVGAALGREADGLTDTLDLCGERCERLFRFNACPKRARVALFEAADAVDAGGEAPGADAAERSREIVGNGPLDFTDKTQGQMQLLLILPAEFGAVVHCVDQQVADVLWRADRDEQAVHARDIAEPSAAGEARRSLRTGLAPARSKHRASNFM